MTVRLSVRQTCLEGTYIWQFKKLCILQFALLLFVLGDAMVLLE